MSSQVDTRQTVLILTKSKDVLEQMRKNRAFKKDAKQEEVFVVQYDSRYFYFKRGVPVTVSKPVADALRRGSGVIIGEAIDGELVSALDIVREFDVTIQSDADRSATVCPICGRDLESIPHLSRHILSHKDERPELFKRQAKPVPVPEPVEDDSAPSEDEIEALET